MSRSFIAGWIPEAAVLRESGQAGLALWSLCCWDLWGKFLFWSWAVWLGSRKPQQWELRRVCLYTHNVVFGVKTADPTAWECLSIWWWPFCQAKCIVQLPELQWFNGGDFYKILHHLKKPHLILIASTPPVCTHWWLSPTASTSSTHSSCSWVGVCSQCKLQEMKKQLPNHPLLLLLLKR